MESELRSDFQESLLPPKPGMYAEKVATAPKAMYVITAPGMLAMKRIQGKIKRYQISSGIIMGSISEKGFGLIQMHLSNGYYNAVFEKSKLLK